VSSGEHGDPYWKVMIRRTVLVLFLLNVIVVFAPALINKIYTNQGFHSPSLYLMWPSIGFWVVAAALLAAFNIL
jgi:hypothetical protein